MRYLFYVAGFLCAVMGISYARAGVLGRSYAMFFFAWSNLATAAILSAMWTLFKKADEESEKKPVDHGPFPG